MEKARNRFESCHRNTGGITQGLGGPGGAASYKVFVVTAEGNERGSNTVTVERPEK